MYDFHNACIRLSDCINCIKMFWQRVNRLCPDPWRVHEREGKKGGLKEGERWPGPLPKIYGRSPRLPEMTTMSCTVSSPSNMSCHDISVWAMFAVTI